MATPCFDISRISIISIGLRRLYLCFRFDLGDQIDNKKVEFFGEDGAGRYEDGTGRYEGEYIHGVLVYRDDEYDFLLEWKFAIINTMVDSRYP